jgi:hypothetical protein
MAQAELGEYLFGRPRPTMGDIVLTLPDSFVHIRASSSIQQLLASFRFRGLGWLLVLLQINSQCLLESSDWLNQVQWERRAWDHRCHQ